MRILGFPVQIRPGFVLFMLLIVVVNGQPMGYWLAGSVTVFTLVHELGHAVAARRTGATASISLDFLAGYASFTPTRVLTRGERASIALAGPGIQIVLGVAALLVMGVNPLSHDDFASDYSSLAIWWAGPMIGLFNLIPVLPLDGGTIAGEIIDVFKPGRGRAVMARVSPPATAVAFVLMVLIEDLRPLAAFAAILLVLQRAGQWWPPHAATPAQLEPLVERVVARLPEPHQNDRTQSAAVLVDVLRRTGRPEVAARYGSRVFALSRSGQVAILVALCTATLGDDENAAQWLTVAARSDAEPTLLLSTLASAPEFARLRERPEIVDLMRHLNSAG